MFMPYANAAHTEAINSAAAIPDTASPPWT